MTLARFIAAAICWLAISGSAYAALTDGLVAYWSLDESSGTTAVDAHSTHDGTASSAFTGVVGKVGNCYEFDEIKLITVTDNAALDLTTAGSIVVWIFPDDLGENILGVMIDHTAGAGGGWNFGLANTDKLRFRNSSGGGDFTSTGAISFGAWNHVAATWTGSTALTFYVNGSAAGTATMGGAPSAVAENLGIGERAWSTARGFDGKVDELGVWSRELSGTEIAELYAGGSGLAYPFSAGGSTFKPRAIVVGSLERRRTPKLIGHVWTNVFALAP